MLSKGVANGAPFIDWITLSEHRPEGGLPLVLRGVTSYHDAAGNCRFERVSPASHGGSYATSVAVGCDGARLYLSGNAGRFSRRDNVFNHDWHGTLGCVEGIVVSLGLPPFRFARDVPNGGTQSGARVHRLDVTRNFAAGSDSQARAVIRWLAGRSVARVKRGRQGDESVWWANTHRMFKAYLKGAELVAHGADPKSRVVQWCQDNGVVRVEVEMKRRLLSRLELERLDDITQERLEEAYEDETAILREVDRSDEPDILDVIPARSRAYAAAWLAGVDVTTIASRATLFRHAKACRAVGINILEPRNVVQFPTRVRIVELTPCVMPDWYSLEVDREDAA